MSAMNVRLKSMLHPRRKYHTDEEVRIGDRPLEVKPFALSVSRALSSKRSSHTPLLKNLSWSLFPTMMSAPFPLVLSVFCVRHCARQSLSTASNAGLIPPSISSTLSLASCPLCSSRIQSASFAVSAQGERGIVQTGWRTYVASM